ncbi:VOC family protein [Gymnodinialimonas ulvae]|uniref:VOC family protein n=1 Tax=Gymnodinialimonas ulvae TaxID=3126504 RepID=UPI0030A9AC8C
MQVDRIDHVHIEVRDRDAAADWYARALGLSRDPHLAAWADDPMGPLILSAGDGAPALSLFARDCAAPTRDATIAFRVSGSAFGTFVESLPRADIVGRDGTRLTAADCVDHGLSHSLYFTDPDGNRIELTTYDLG